MISESLIAAPEYNPHPRLALSLSHPNELFTSDVAIHRHPDHLVTGREMENRDRGDAPADAVHRHACAVRLRRHDEPPTRPNTWRRPNAGGGGA